MSIVVTGATGLLGGLVIENLLKKVPASQIVASVRNPEKAAPLAARGVEVRRGDYMDPESLKSAFAGATKLLFIPSPDSDDTLRILQHANVVNAAKAAGVKHIIYPGYAFAETSKIPLAWVHLSTEYAIRTTQIPFTFLRNPLYTDVFVNPGLHAAVAQGALVTNTGNGRLNTVTREDLARATAAVLVEEGHENQVYNLVSDQTWSFDDLAGILSEITGKQVVHQAVSFEEAKASFLSAGLPEPVAAMVAGIYGAVAMGETAATSGDLKKLIGEQTPLKESVRQALQG